MPTTSEATIERFRRRTQATDDVTLERNLRAGVYGAPGSQRRTVAETALALRRAERAQALQAATEHERAELIASVAVARRAARTAAWVAGVALVLAVAAALLALRALG